MQSDWWIFWWSDTSQLKLGCRGNGYGDRRRKKLWSLTKWEKKDNCRRFQILLMQLKCNWNDWVCNHMFSSQTVWFHFNLACNSLHTVNGCSSSSWNFTFVCFCVYTEPYSMCWDGEIMIITEAWEKMAHYKNRLYMGISEFIVKQKLWMLHTCLLQQLK